jgi:hypothetical protein
MCFSATASFVASGSLAVIGVATLRQVKDRRSLLFGSVPLLFAVHQFVEGIVWLSLNGQLRPEVLPKAALLFRLYAQGLLPFLMPAAVLLMEPRGWRRRAIASLTGAGAIVCAWDLFGLLFYPNQTYIEHHSIAYRNALTGNLWISLVYIIGTCGSLMLSSHRVLRWYGAINLIVLIIVQIVREYAFASVWCFYAAIMSAMIYWHFRKSGGEYARLERAQV